MNWTEIIIYNIIFWSVLIGLGKLFEKSFQAAIETEK